MKKLLVGIVPHVGRNIASIERSIQIQGHESVLVNDVSGLDGTDCLILPGVGAFDVAMSELNRFGFIDPLRKYGLSRPLLGICVGFQILAESSAEGIAEGLGLLPGHCIRLPEHAEERIPNTNWMEVKRSGPGRNWLADFPNPRFYFVHSFVVQPDHPDSCALAAQYGGADFVAAADMWPIRGSQFHPEKSHRFGINYFRDFFGKVLEG
jgi:imidazole glycerol-phosphate synthase subunit HisH